jgi:CHAD domain-containing protein
MKVSSVHSVLKNKLHKLRRMIAAPQMLSSNEEGLHRLRVGLKEWRAALRLVQGIDPEFPCAETSERFRPVFDTAGRMRFWQLQRRFLDRTGSLVPDFAAHYRGRIRARLRQARRSFAAAVANADWPRWRELDRDVHRAGEACTLQALRAYFDRLQGDMTSKKTGLHRRRTSELHELRKALREYSDNRKLAVKRLGFDPGSPRNLGPDIPALQSRLGDWHDQDAACRQLAEDLRYPGWEEEALQQGKKLLRAWRRNERTMWDRIMTDLASS